MIPAKEHRRKSDNTISAVLSDIVKSMRFPGFVDTIMNPVMSVSIESTLNEMELILDDGEAGMMMAIKG
jgi:hypothetical protein